MQLHQVPPRWLTLAAASAYSGLSERLLAELIKDREVVSSLPKRKGRKSGRRLILRESLDQFIERGIEELVHPEASTSALPSSEAALTQ